MKLQPGMTFSRLTIVGRSHPDSSGRWYWKCMCVCGTAVTVRADAIQRPEGVSCGCYAKEASTIRSTTHGRSRTRTYHCWKMMLQRCLNPKCKAYPGYGGRGITVCEEWQTSFEAFFQDMGEQPEGLSIERRKVNEGYSKSNCYWATMDEQQNNKRNTIVVTYGGQDMPLSAYARKVGRTPSAVSMDKYRGKLKHLNPRQPNKEI